MRAAGARPVHLHKVASLRSGRKCPVTGGSHGVVWLCLDACSWLSGAVAGRTRGAVSRRVRAPRLSDPIVLSHAQALLTSSPEGMTDYIQADLRDTDTILKGAARILDFTRPVAILLIAVLHFIPDADDPYAIVARLMDAAPSGSYLVMAHAASDIAPGSPASSPPRPAPARPGPHQQVGPLRPDRLHYRRPGRLLRHRPQTLSIRASTQGLRAASDRTKAA